MTPSSLEPATIRSVDDLASVNHQPLHEQSPALTRYLVSSALDDDPGNQSEWHIDRLAISSALISKRVDQNCPQAGRSCRCV